MGQSLSEHGGKRSWK